MRFRTLCAVGMVVFASVAAAQATVWDAYSQFDSGHNDPANVWSYHGVGEGTNGPYWLAGTYGAFPGGVAGINAWCQGPDSFPAVGVQGGEVVLHPAEGTALAIAWNSPVAGDVKASFLVHDLNSGADGPGDHPAVPYDGVSYRLVKGEGTTATALASGYVVNGGTSNTVSVDVTVAVGDKLYLQIGDAVANHWYDFTGATFSISQVPEPSTMVMLGIGLLSLLAYAWRRRK